ncbi:MAG: zinc metalloprotease HtpX [Veillonella sp.]|nr:zinc metalloprotease HtpX [Veillonella sp.]
MNSVKTAVLLALLSAILMVIGQYVGGSKGLIVMFIISLGMNFFSYWKSDSIVLAQYNAKEVTEQDHPMLYNTVKRLAANAQLPMPRVYIIPTETPNAFATGRNPEHAAVAVTEGIMGLLTQDELEGVLAHELTHVKNRDTLISTIAAVMASVITMVANMLQMFAIFGHSDDDREESSNPIAMIAMMILAPLAASIIQMAISRSREYMADEGGANMCGKPLALASALAKIDHYARYGALPHAGEATAHMFIVNPLSYVKSLGANLFSTHPSTEERIKRLQAMAQP